MKKRDDTVTRLNDEIASLRARVAELERSGKSDPTSVTALREDERANPSASNLAQIYLDLVGVIMIAANTEGIITMINQTGCRILGYSEQELIGQNWFDVVVPARIRANTLSTFHRLMSGELTGGEYYENPIVTKSGEERMLAWHNTLLRDQAGQIIGTLSSGNDITEKVKIEEELRNSRNMLSQVLNAVPQSLFWKDRNSVYLGCNQIYAQACGVASPAEVVGKTDFDLPLMKADADDYRADDLKVVTANQPRVHATQPLRQADGSSRLFDSTKVPLMDAQGNIGGILGVYEDITEHIEAEEEIHKSEERFKQLAENAGEWIWEIDQAGVYTYCSPAVETILGYKPEELVGRMHYFDLMIPDEWEKMKDSVIDVMNRHDSFRGFININLHRNGEHMVLETSGVPIMNSQGTLIGYRGVDTDITERSRAERALRESEERLRLKLDSILSPDVEISEQELMNILDAPEIQSLLEDFSKLTGMTTAILDIKGNVLVSTGWQDICMQFHRLNPDTAKYCTQSDLHLSQHIQPGEYLSYKCKNQMWDVVTPLYIGDKHVGNIYSGQYFLDDEQIDIRDYAEQADRYGFDRDAYLDALRRVPRHRKRDIDTLMDFLVKFSAMVSKLSYSNLKLVKSMSDQKRTAEELRRSRNMLAQILDTVPQAIFWKDRNGAYLGCNRVYVKACGADNPEQVVGKSDFDMPWPRADAEAYRADDAEVIASLRPKHHIIEQLQQAGGARIWIDTTKVPLLDETGNVLGVLGVYEDITERKRAEEIIEQQLNFMQKMIDTIPSAIFYKDLSGRYLGCNTAYETILGMTKEEIKGKSVYDVAPPDLADIYREADLALFRNPGVQIYESTMQYADGVRHDVLFNKATYTDLRGEVQGMVGVVVDVSERNRADEALRESEAHFRALFEQSSLGISLLDPNGSLIDINPALEEMLGYSKQEIEELRNNEVTHPEDRGRDRDVFRDVLSGAHDHADLEKRFLHKSGRVVWTHLTLFGIQTGADRPRLVVGMIENITERKMAEETLRQSEERFHSVFQTSPDSITMSRLDDRILVEINDGFSKLTGFSREEALGHTSLSLGVWTVKERKRFDNLLEQHGIVENFETTIHSQDGTEIAVLISARTLTLYGETYLLVISRDITVLKRVESELRASEQKFREMSDLLPQSVFECDLRGVLTFANKRAFQNFGYDASDLSRGMHVLEALIPEDRERGATNFSELINVKSTLNIEYTGLRKDGSSMPVIIYSAPMIRDGRCVGIRGVIVDITERKRSEEALLESEKRYRTLYQNTPVMLYSIDNEARLISVSNYFLTKTGYSREDVLGRRFLEFLTTESRTHATKKVLPGLFKTGCCTDIPLQVVKRNGEVIEVLLSATGEEDRSGNVVRSLAVLIDVTERKRAEEALLDSETKFREMFHFMTEGMALHEVVYDQNGEPVDYRIIDVNPAFERFTGKSASVAKGMLASELYGTNAPPYLEIYAQVAHTGIPHHFQTFFEPLQKHFEISCFSPKFRSFATIFEDISERVQSEDDLHNSREQLRQLTAHIESAREDERKWVAREIHDELGQVLTALKMDLAWIKKRLPAEQMWVKDKTTEMHSLVESAIQSVKKISSRLRPIPLEDLGFEAAIEWLVQDFSERTGIFCHTNLAIKNISLTTEHCTAVFRILQETLNNVARHAKATEVKISLVYSSGSVILRVEDNGIGISSTLFKELKSFGLIGMRERARYFGGDVKINSSVGQGTNIIATIPLRKGGQSDKDPYSR